VVRGAARVTVNEDVKTVHENESVYIPFGAVHRLENPDKILLELIEVQTGSYLGEDDIIRILPVLVTPASVPFVASTTRRRKRDQHASSHFVCGPDLMILGCLPKSYHRILILSHGLRRSRQCRVNRI
jgi:hypothetical protein